MTGQDHPESARQALWLVRKTLDETPAGGTIAPGLREVYHHADLAHSALTTTGDVRAALEDARTARRTLQAATIDGARLERWLGTDAGGETVEAFLRQIDEDLDAAVRALEAEVGSR